MKTCRQWCGLLLMPQDIHNHAALSLVLCDDVAVAFDLLLHREIRSLQEHEDASQTHAYPWVVHAYPWAVQQAHGMRAPQAAHIQSDALQRNKILPQLLAVTAAHPCCNQEAAAGRRQDLATVTLHAAAGLPIHTYCLPALPCTAVGHLMQSTCLQLWHNVTTCTGEVTCHMHEDQALLC